MRSVFATGALLLVGAATSTAQWLDQTERFNLMVHSADNATLSGSYLRPCHAGAAIEALCVVPVAPTYDDAPIFRFNYSAADAADNGYLTWVLRGANFNLSEPLTLYTSPTSNVALPLLQPPRSGGQPVGFDRDDKMYIPGYIDDTVVPANASESRPFYRWLVCDILYVAYRYRTLAWTLGVAEPQNPSCVAVNVTREFP